MAENFLPLTVMFTVNPLTGVSKLYSFPLILMVFPILVFPIV